ncbi:MAG: APC family permease [Armatimonadota bacterium]|nr:MAG: APC family permease [Armatimonadota bacterium]
MADTNEAAPRTNGHAITLARDLGLLALVATAVCNVIGAGINIVSVGIQQKIPGIGPYVPLAFVFGVLPALLTALCYAVLASAMPRAGGGYIYVSRALHPFLGFMATFSKWFGLAAVIGVLAYMDVALLQSGIGYLSPYLNVAGVFAFLGSSAAKLVIPLAMIWFFWAINIIGVRTYAWTVIILMVLMLLGGLAVIATGFLHGPQDFAAAFAGDAGAVLRATLAATDLAGMPLPDISATAPPEPGGIFHILKAAAFLFFAYIGFASISQAGGEARNPRRILPRAFIIATTVICAYYLLFSAAVYHAIPWHFIAGFVKAAPADASVPLLIGVLMPPALASFVALMAALALANDIPPMLLATSRLFFAWARDGVFPRGLASINRRFRTPHWALTACALVATTFVLLCYLWESYFTGVDTVVIALTFTYLLISISVLTFPRRSPTIFRQVAFIRSRPAQIIIACLAILCLFPLLVLEVFVLGGEAAFFWLGAMIVGAILFLAGWLSARARGVNLPQVFATLPTTAEEEEPASEAI